MSATDGYVLNQTMLRVKDPEASLSFYQDVLGMTLLDRYDFESMEFSLYFLGYPTESPPEDADERAEGVFAQPALIELTHNWEDPDGYWIEVLSPSGLRAIVTRG